MRGLALFPILTITACAAPTNAPSLAPRPAEAIDPRVPVPEPVLATNPDPALVARLDSLVVQAQAGDAAFAPLAEQARTLARASGAAQSESWVVAQQALSAAIAARRPVAQAVGDVDAMAADTVDSLGGIGAANLKAIKSAAARIAEIDNREAASVSAIQALLAR